MTPIELERYLHEHIPLSHAMRVGVVTVDAGTVVLRAPLEPNINHRETVFGGSASALAILAAW
jgi:thioesterase domain-containing protein